MREETGELLLLATDLARQAAQLLRDRFGGVREVVSTKSSPTDMVSEVDRASERLIVDGLRRARPDDAILGEEGSRHIGTSGYRWVLDPLDGTTNYLYGLPAYAVSIAVEYEGEVEAGVVADAAHDETFCARKGEAATCNGRIIECGTLDEISHALVGTGYSYQAVERARQGEMSRTVLPRVRDLRRTGSAAIDLCWVACGRLDAYFEQGLAPWDLAAGAIIARQAGAVTGDLCGGPASTTFALAAGPALFGPLRALLTTASETTPA